MTGSIPLKDVIRILEEIGVLLELKGESPFKSIAYANAARRLESLDEDLDALVSRGGLTSIKGIGEALSRKITELVTTGRLEYYEKLKASVPPGHLEMLRIPGLGPKKIRALHEKLSIETLGELEYACMENRLVELPGFGARTQEKILAGIEHLKRYRERRLCSEALAAAEPLLAKLQGHPGVVEASMAGSLRRGNETVKDIDLVAAANDSDALSSWFASQLDVESVIARGGTKVSVFLKAGINADLRIVSPREYPFALHHFTGSKEHNVAMRGRAKQLGIKMNEYGLFRDDALLTCRSEQEVFAALGLAWVPPELRENTGELEAAETGVMPSLVEMKDIRGIFHIHTTASDGASTLEALVAAAKRMGLEYIGITDHSESAFYAGGLTPEDVRKQHRAIDALNRRDPAFRIFKGIEADILPDGRLDYDEATLGSFDFVIAAVHSHFGMSGEEMTRRILRALENRRTTILAHPTGRLLLAREPYALDLERVIDAAAALGKVIELNANPHRLDLDWRHCKYAKRQGARIAVNPDAHHVEGLADMRYGLSIARKGWLEAPDIINSMGLEEMTAFLEKNRN
ncbi:MAG TPA: DNA polymerase/3'-5' exonuclease PolX [Syntrophales bacterium]|nr:DNA polymerase/3'-5' exonuclease PolX [Syntrophales bacterium]